MEISLRPDGMLVFGGDADEDASMSLGLMNGKTTAQEEPSVRWLRRRRMIPSCFRFLNRGGYSSHAHSPSERRIRF